MMYCTTVVNRTIEIKTNPNEDTRTSRENGDADVETKRKGDVRETSSDISTLAIY